MDGKLVASGSDDPMVKLWDLIADCVKLSAEKR
jgi:hypothetical protein